MEINIYTTNKDDSSELVKLNDGIIFVHLSEEEAVSLIGSLSSQITLRSENIGRVESRTRDGNYFSIAVSDYKYTKEEYRLKERIKELYQRTIKGGVL